MFLVDDVAHALADPARRRILEALSVEPLAAGEIAAKFTISRPAVSRHLRVLRESGLVVDEIEGRQRIYTMNTAALRPLSAWITRLERAASFEQDWDRKLDALGTEVRRTRRERERDRPRPSIAQEHNKQEDIA